MNQPYAEPDSLPPVPDPATAPSEPLLTVGGIGSAATALISLLLAFGLPLSGGKQEAILSAVAIIAPILVAVVGRSKVFSPRTVALMIGRHRAL